MKSFIMLFIAVCTTFGTFAQKAKSSSTTKSPATVQVSYTCPMHPEVMSDKPGKCPKCNMDLSLSKKEQLKMEVTNNYTCPMHTEVVSDHTGTCPKCGTQFVADRKGSKQGSKVYRCSMHADVASNKPGKCPVCKMDLKQIKPNSKSKKA